MVNTRSAGLTIDQATGFTIRADPGAQLSRNVIAETPQKSLNIALDYKDDNLFVAKKEAPLFDPLQYLDKQFLDNDKSFYLLTSTLDPLNARDKGPNNFEQTQIDAEIAQRLKARRFASSKLELEKL